MRASDKPRHLGSDYAAQFCEAAIVRAYAARPAYPAGVFEALRALLPWLPGERARALELGCGSGDLTFGLSAHVAELIALDPSPAMLSAALARRARVPDNIRFVLSSAEAFEPQGQFELVVAAESLHWMEWSSVLPKIARCLAAQGSLAIVLTREWLDLPWANELRGLIAQYSTNRDYAPYDLVEELVRRGFFAERGRTRVTQAGVRQDLETYVESFHSRNGLSRERMGEVAASEFDGALRALVSSHRSDGHVTGEVAATVVWGSPASR